MHVIQKDKNFDEQNSPLDILAALEQTFVQCYAWEFVYFCKLSVRVCAFDWVFWVFLSLFVSMCKTISKGYEKNKNFNSVTSCENTEHIRLVFILCFGWLNLRFIQNW